MFSSNQIFEISGSLGGSGELEIALKAALELSGREESFTRCNGPRAKMTYQITPSGKYAIGWCWEDTPANGWAILPFDYDLGIVAAIIRKHLEKQTIHYGGGDGSYSKGFLMHGRDYDEIRDDVQSPFYCLLTVEPFTCFYAK